MIEATLRRTTVVVDAEEFEKRQAVLLGGWCRTCSAAGVRVARAACATAMAAG